MRMTTLIFDYRCAVCWSALIERDGQAICARYPDEHRGYHRLSGITWAREHSDLDRREVIRLYQDVPPFSYLLGLAKRPEQISAESLQRNRRALCRDDSGLY